LNGNSLKTWDEVVEKFLKKYFPESKTVEGKAAISSFHQFPNESLSEALEKFCGLLRKTPTHGFSEPIQLNIFMDGLRPQSKQLLDVDASAGGKIKLRTPEEAKDLIENMATSDIAILRDRVHIPSKKSLLELTSQDALLAQNKLLSKQLEALTETLSCQLKFILRILHILLFCRLQDAQFMVVLMNLDVASLMKNKSRMKSITWGTSPETILMQVDFPDSSMNSNTTNNRDNGGTIL